MHGVIQNKLVGLVTNTVDYSRDNELKLREQQLLWLELHLLINDISQTVNVEYGIEIAKTLEDTLDILKVAAYKQVLKDGEGFDFMNYLYHVRHTTDDQKGAVSLHLSSNQLFDVTTRGRICLPEFQKMFIKIKETTKLPTYSQFGLSREPGKDMLYK